MGILGPRLPVDSAQREWVDRSLTELAELFGPAAEWQTILPTSDYFPAHFDGTTEAVISLVERTCRWLRVDQSELDVDVFADPADDGYDRLPDFAMGRTTVAGDYVPTDNGRGTIGIHREDLTNPLILVATVAHELAHHLLISHKGIPASRSDGEGLTDLLTTHLGLGIISANAQRQNRASYAGTWASVSLGYLSSQTYGYALACRALAMNQPDPPWARYLAPNPLGYMRASLKALLRG